jgi:hypothetical protein
MRIQASCSGLSTNWMLMQVTELLQGLTDHLRRNVESYLRAHDGGRCAGLAPGPGRKVGGRLRLQVCSHGVEV